MSDTVRSPKLLPSSLSPGFSMDLFGEGGEHFFALLCTVCSGGSSASFGQLRVVSDDFGTVLKLSRVVFSGYALSVLRVVRSSRISTCGFSRPIMGMPVSPGAYPLSGVSVMGSFPLSIGLCGQALPSLVGCGVF